MSSSDNPSSTPWTYRMEVSPTGQGPIPADAGANDPMASLNVMVNLQSQSLEIQRQTLELVRQQTEMIRETTQVAREQRARQIADLERWQQGHADVLEHCQESLGKLEQVHASLMSDLSEYIDDNHENLVEGDFALSDFVDRFGPRLAHLNTMLAILRPLAAAAQRKAAAEKANTNTAGGS